jgi:hypothetical protein
MIPPCPECGQEFAWQYEARRHAKLREKAGGCPGKRKPAPEALRGPKAKPPKDPLDEDDYQWARDNWT